MRVWDVGIAAFLRLLIAMESVPSVKGGFKGVYRPVDRGASTTRPTAGIADHPHWMMRRGPGGSSFASERIQSKGAPMADLVAIGYDDEATAAAAAEEVDRLGCELVVEPDAVATVVRDKDGKYDVTTNHHAVGSGASYGMFWSLLFAVLFFDEEFQREVRDMVQPGTSALFLVVEKVTPDKAVERLSRFGGTVLKSSLSRDAQHKLQDALHGTPAS
jgi:uncharacterized membrane protein